MAASFRNISAALYIATYSDRVEVPILRLSSASAFACLPVTSSYASRSSFFCGQTNSKGISPDNQASTNVRERTDTPYKWEDSGDLIHAPVKSDIATHQKSPARENVREEEGRIPRSRFRKLGSAGTL